MRRVPGGVGGWLAERAAAHGRPASSGRNAPTADRTAPRGKPKTARTGPSPSTIGRRLRETEQAMVKAQKRVDTLHAELATETDHTVLAERGITLAAAQAELDELEAQWLELAELAE